LIESRKYTYIKIIYTSLLYHDVG